MSVISKSIKGAAWLASYKAISQICSWLATIYVVRLLNSDDYGVMELATIFTGFVALFVEFGIGAAIINKENLNKDELSTAFWFSALWGVVLSLTCFILAPITASYYNEPRVIHLTQCTSLIFIFASLAIVPRAILARELRFKDIAFNEFLTIIFACLTMVILASLGAGPWTLLLGTVAKEFSRFILFFKKTKFVPKFIFSKKDLLPLIQFGTPVMLASSLFYVYGKSDRFFGGSAFSTIELGYYAMALQIAAIPVEKIVSLLQSVLFPALSRLKNDRETFIYLYLSFLSLIAFITLPMFIGGALMSKELIIVIFGEKWLPALPTMRILFIAQLFIALSSPNSLTHAAIGKPIRNLIFNLILTPALIISFYYSSQYSEIHKLAIPWVTVFPLLQLCYILYTNKDIGLSFSKYIKSLVHPIAATTLMSASVLFFYSSYSLKLSSLSLLTSCVSIGAIVYSVYFLTLGKTFINSLIELKNI